MNKLLLFFVITIFVFTACTPEPKELTPEDLAKEKEAIINIIKVFNKASEEKNFSSIVDILSEDVVFFGTDSAEIITSFPEFKKAIMKQWDLFDKTDYGEMADVSIQMDKNASIASIIYGIPMEVTIADKTASLYLRVERTLKKEKGKWVIVSGIVGSVGTQRSSELDGILKQRIDSLNE